MAILLLCSQIGLDLESNVIKPYTARHWAELSEKLNHSSMKSPEAFLHTTAEDWTVNLDLSLGEVNRIKALLSRTAQLEEELEQLQSIGIYLTTSAENNYPDKLKARLKEESPPVLYYSGDLHILQFPTIAVFGATYSDDASTHFTEVLAEKCAKQGFTILTGGGIAVDSTAEASALQSGGNTACFLSYGFIQKLEQEEVHSAVSSGSLLLLSAAHPRAPLTLRSSMEKNKYLYGLADYAVVVSAENRKGITYNGAVENLKKYKVPLFVRKDDNMPEGNAALLEQGGVGINQILMYTTLTRHCKSEK
jgi:predicted Rossmann fold nucleotide-binding protein DprA/Smf involved in DNA uptake